MAVSDYGDKHLRHLPGLEKDCPLHGGGGGFQPGIPVYHRGKCRGSGGGMPGAGRLL